MKLGVCTGPENIALAAQMGYDYIEWGMAKVASLTEEEFQAILAQKPSFPIPIAKCNSFLPGDVKVSGPEANEAAQRAYLERALSRAHALGVDTVVFGSGAARGVPEGWPFPEAWRQIAVFLKLTAEYCDKYQVNIAIEPLRRQECNIVNLVSEGVILSALVDHPRIGALGDTFHMLSSHEPWDAFTHAGKSLLHVHISQPLADMSGRVYPAPGDGQDYAAVADTLKAMGYEGGVSIEAGCKDFAREAEAAYQVLAPLFK